ncbi:hypothetical protein GWI33_009401 [Rhynchophorus ferrugineus]|uniref:Uncharacterized protein n=1 Tax=Rhynchophorus ferrugineus TaxID=354439 RepID=A0A834IDL1_RHYFE|nr:hypothetical protein GWI33_009401 [Rhynchophorus ferrugineus]
MVFRWHSAAPGVDSGRVEGAPCRSRRNKLGVGEFGKCFKTFDYRTGTGCFLEFRNERSPLVNETKQKCVRDVFVRRIILNDRRNTTP